jgi:gas vesicle protein
MYYEENKSHLHFVSGLLIGAVIGAGVALLAAPASGQRTRRQMIRGVASVKDQAGAQVDEWADDLRRALRRSRRRRARA